MDPNRFPDARVPLPAMRAWNMTGARWRTVIRASMRHLRAERFAITVRMARMPMPLSGNGPYICMQPLPEEYEYEPNDLWLDVGGEGGA